MSQADRSRTRRWQSWVLSLAISVALLGWLLSQIDLGELRRAATNLSPRYLTAFLAIYACGVIARAARFWLLLGRQVGVRLVLAITLVRNLFVDLLPARLGELSFVYLVAQRAGRPAEDGVAALVLSLMLDVVVIAPLAAVAIVGAGLDWGLSTGALIALSAALTGGALVAVWIAGPIARWLMRRLAGPQGGSWRSWLVERLGVLAGSLDRARAAGVLVPALAITAVIRICKYSSFYFLVLAILTPLGYTSERLDVGRVFLSALAVELVASLPVHGLAGFGTYEAAWTLSFTQLGYSREDAVVSGLLAHVIGQVLEYTVGAAALIGLAWSSPSGRAVRS